MPKAVSKKQARLFGAIAGGAVTSSMTPDEAKKHLRGVHYKELPESAPKKKKRKK